MKAKILLTSYDDDRVFIIMKKISVKNLIKIIISILLGLGITLMYCLIFYYTFFSPQYSRIEIMYFLLSSVTYISGILFLIFWNKLKSKLVYIMLIIPTICIALMVVYSKYLDYQEHLKYVEKNTFIKNIPVESESDTNLHIYRPFRENNLLAKLDEESSLKLTKNIPNLDGATALYPVYASFVQAVYPEGEYYYLSRAGNKVLCSRSAKAYENLYSGIVDIIFCLEPSDSLLKHFNDNGIKLQLIPIGREAFVFFVNIDNPINNLTQNNIRGIYSGAILNWKELNWIDQKIVSFQRPKDSGSQTMLEKIMGDVPIMQPYIEHISPRMGEIIREVANYGDVPNGIGYSFLHFLTKMERNDPVNLLSIDGVFPSKETVQNGSYPFSENFYAIYIESDNKNKNIELFINWILSSQGQELLSKTGYTPIIN